MSLNAGDLDREILLQRATKTQDAETGEEVTMWSAGDRIWAQWLPGSTREAWMAQQRLSAYIDGIFRMYWRGDITPDQHRIVWGATVFDIKGTTEIGRREGLDVVVVARGE
jgi:head-tail adaptor